MKRSAQCREATLPSLIEGPNFPRSLSLGFALRTTRSAVSRVSSAARGGCGAEAITTAMQS